MMDLDTHSRQLSQLEKVCCATRVSIRRALGLGCNSNRHTDCIKYIYNSESIHKRPSHVHAPLRDRCHKEGIIVRWLLATSRTLDSGNKDQWILARVATPHCVGYERINNLHPSGPQVVGRGPGWGSGSQKVRVCGLNTKQDISTRDWRAPADRIECYGRVDLETKEAKPERKVPRNDQNT